MTRIALFFLLALSASLAAAQSAPAVKQRQLESPKKSLFVGNSYDEFGKVDKATAAFLQQVAWETVTKFYGR